MYGKIVSIEVKGIFDLKSGGKLYFILEFFSYFILRVTRAEWAPQQRRQQPPDILGFLFHAIRCPKKS